MPSFPKWLHLGYEVLRNDYMKLKFPDDENRYGSRNDGLLAIQPPDTAAGPRKFY